MAAKKGKGHVPLDILEKRYKKLGRIIKERGGDAGVTPDMFARNPPKKPRKR